MKKFLTSVAEQIIAGHGNNLAHVLVLMPNQRSCTYFRNELKMLATKALLTPEITTLQNWMLAQSDLVVADNIELLTDLYACYKGIGGELSLDDFIGTANVMLDDFNELDLQMADAKTFFRNLELLQSMKTYEPGGSPTEYKIKYRKFWEEFGLLYQHLRKRLQAKGKGYTGMILREVAEKVKLSSGGSFAESPVYLVGFSGLNKTDEVMMKYFVTNHQAEVFWDADEYYVHDEVNEAGAFFRKHQSAFRINKEKYYRQIAGEPKSITVIGAAKNIGQVKVTADILQNKLRLTETELLDTVVVVPDEKLLGPLLGSLPSNISAVNITMGISMVGTNPVTWLEILFRLYENSKKYKGKTGEQRFYYKDVFELLQHTFLRLLFGKVPIDHFVDTLKQQNRVLIRREEISTAFQGKLNSLLFDGDDSGGFAAYLESNISFLLDALIKKVKAGHTSLAPDAEITFRVLNILKNTGTIFQATAAIEVKTYIALLREAIHHERVPLEGDPVQGLQIMGLQETRSLDFKNVVILSANEGILPSGKAARSYIPYEMRREFLTTYKERDAVTAYLFYRLLHKAENVFILYNTEPDELGGGEKSRFILQLEKELPAANPKAEIKDLIFAVDPPTGIGEQEIKIEKTEQVLERLDKILTESGLSPSAINTYINCSLQYYFRYIAGLKEQDEMEESMEAATIGSAVHYALEKIYETQMGEAVSLEYIESVANDKERIEALVREHLAKRFDMESLSRGKNLLLYKVCVKLVQEFLKYEKQHLQELSESGLAMQIEMLEGKLKHPIDINGKQVFIQGRVDRIEKKADVVHIADFKTSTRSSIPVLNDETWEELVNDPSLAKPIQLLIYAWLYTQSAAGKDVAIRSGIYWLRDSDKQLHTLRADKTTDIITYQVVKQFEDKLKQLLSGLIDPHQPFTKAEDKERCRYCEYIHICARD